MRKELLLMLAGAWAFTILARAESGPLFPFVLPWDDASPGITDFSDLLHKPAGRFGHIESTPEGQFHAGDRRIRFFGVNVSFAGGMPEKEHAPAIAGRLAKFGVNIVRFHHMDTARWPNGLLARNAKSTGDLDPEALDRLDYFVAELKKQGIYSNINLLVGRPFTAADGLPAEIEQINWKQRHIVGFFDPVQLELQKEFARTLLGHRNPYTQLTYAADPAVAFVEINNENGLVHAWLGGEVDRLPAVFQEQLRQQWNEWLQARYSTETDLNRAWSKGAAPTGPDLLKNGSFTSALDNWVLEQHGGARATVAVSDDLPEKLGAGTPSKSVRITIEEPGSAGWHVQWQQRDLELKKGQPYTLTFRARADAPRSFSVSASQARESWDNLGLAATVSARNQWQEFRLVFNAGRDEHQARINFNEFGPSGAVWHLTGISLQAGGVFGLRPGETMPSLPLFARALFGERTPAAQQDWIRFLLETEDGYWQALYRFLKQDLGVRAPVAGTIVGCSTPNLMAKLDWVDTHAYWQHPRFPGRPWDPENWLVENRTMVNERGGTLPGLATKRVFGKPHAVTEYNHPAPNTYSSETCLLLAAYAGLQDWDGIYIYSYAHSRQSGWDLRRISSFFDIDQHPLKMATLLPAAAMFLREDVRPARQLVVAELGIEREIELLGAARAWSLVDGTQAGMRRETALLHRVALVTEGQTPPPDALALDTAVAASGAGSDIFVSDTRELVWDVSRPGRGVVSLNSDKSKAVIGYGGGRVFSLGQFTLEPGKGFQDGWAAITLTDRSGDQERWLVTATSYAENTGMGWKNAEKTTVGRDWGRAPSLVEGVQARLSWDTPADQVEFWSLDERGRRKAKLPVRKDAGGRTILTLSPEWQTIWYEIARTGGTAETAE